MNRRTITLAVSAILGVLLLVWGVRAWRFAATHESTDNAQVDGHIVPVLAKVGGYVEQIAVNENDPVRAGQLLVHIDESELRQRMAQAEADYQASIAAAGLNGSTGQAEAMVLAASGQHSALEAQIIAARSTAQRARADLARAEDLAKQQIISRAQLDAARSAAEAAEANVTALERQTAAAGAGVSNARAGVKLAEARMLSARANRDYAALQLGYARVSAPENGRATRKQVEVGQLVQAGQPLMWIVVDTGVWVTANFKETQVASMKPGQPADIEVDAYDGCHVEGRVASISSATGAKFALLPPDNATGNFTKVVQRVPVRIEITRGCGADRPLRPGMSVVARIRTG